LILLIVAFVSAATYFGPGRFVAEGYTVVNLKDGEAHVNAAPDEPTLYIGRAVTYSAPLTSVPVAIIAREITVSGDFLKKVSLTGAKVTALSTARFAENLKVYAAEFIDQGITLKGELSGRVMKSLP